MRPGNLQARIDHWIFDSHSQSAESLSFYRIVFGLFLLIFAMPDPTWVSELPDAIFDPPPGPLRLLDGFPPRAFIQVLVLILCISAVALLLGVKTKASSLTVGVLLIVLIGFEHCLGKIDHNRILLSVTPLALAYSTWGRRYAVDPPRDSVTAANANWPQTLLALLVALFFLSGGLPKLWSGWLRLAGQKTAQHMGRSELGSQVADALPAFALEIGDFSVVAFEIGFVFAVLAGLHWTRIFCALAMLFHVLVLVMLSITFPEQLIVYGAFVDWDRLRVVRQMGRWLDSFCRYIRSASWLVVMIGGVAYFTLHITVGSPLSTNSRYSLVQKIAYWMPPTIVACWYLYSQLRAAHFGHRERFDR